MSRTFTNNRPTIVFDAGGVLFADGMSQLLHWAADQGGTDYDQLDRLYRSEVRNQIMNGKRGGEAAFWQWLRNSANISASDDALHARMREIQVPLPALARIPEWAKNANLRVLSNHLAPWLRDWLGEAGMTRHFDKVSISSETGLLKPEPAAFAEAYAGLPRGSTIYVDDKTANLDVARRFGVSTLRADSAGRWTENLDVWLANARSFPTRPVTKVTDVVHLYDEATGAPGRNLEDLVRRAADVADTWPHALQLLMDGDPQLKSSEARDRGFTGPQLLVKSGLSNAPAVVSWVVSGNGVNPTLEVSRASQGLTKGLTG